LLRVVMAVIDFPTTKIAAWEVPELNGAEREDVERTIFLNPELQRLSHSDVSEQSVWKETMRVPVRLAYALRKTIHSQNQRVSEPAHVALESRLHASVDAFMQGYYGMRVFLTTPVPFPLVQMARTFLFLYVFTIPFVLLADKSGLLAHVGAVFVMTYGFVGLELVAIELDNPFGDDDNDFDNDALARTVFEDTYLTVMDVDGIEWAEKLRVRMQERKDHNGSTAAAAAPPPSSEQTPLMNV